MYIQTSFYCFQVNYKIILCLNVLIICNTGNTSSTINNQETEKYIYCIRARYKKIYNRWSMQYTIMTEKTNWTGHVLIGDSLSRDVTKEIILYLKLLIINNTCSINNQ